MEPTSEKMVTDVKYFEFGDRSDFREGLRMGAEIFHALKSLLSAAGHSTAVGDEGGFAPAINSSDEALDYISRSVEAAGCKLGEDAVIALDAAATEFYCDGKYHLAGADRSLTSAEMVDMRTGTGSPR